MTERLADAALDRIFRSARSRNSWKSDPLPEGALREIYELAKWGPTAANSNPARFVFVVSDEAKERLAAASSGNNQPKIKAAPATVIVAYDLDFPATMPKLFPHVPTMKDNFKEPAVTEQTAFRNSTLQGAYLMLAARALGYDCGPMSGFNNAKVDELFFAGTNIKSNFICSIGYGDVAGQFDRLPRHDFDEACKII